MKRLHRIAVCLLVFASSSVTAQRPIASWPTPTVTARPWTRWWWLGSAVDSAGITRELTALSLAGFGGVEVTPLYGARGAEASYVPYLSPAWTALFIHTAMEAHRLGMQVDLPLGSGWRTGGPFVPPAETNASIHVAIGAISGAETSYVATTVTTRDSVKRAAPGGEGPAIDPFSGAATSHWLSGFGARLGSLPKGAVRAYFHDSFEYTGNGSNELFAEFARRRGYDLGTELGALAGHGSSDRIARVKSDYRQTLDEMLLGNFVDSVASWSHARGGLFREQAHGSPGNLIDIYAQTDIPETESFGPLGGADANPLVMRFASSAAHVAGRPLVSAESFTWLGEHFSTPLGDMKRDADMLFLAGINHLVYHGTAYSPTSAAWPGWQFYASMELNPRNAIWHDVPAFNAYITRVQSMLQRATPDNDVLLYWPIWDNWSDSAGMRMDFRVHLPTWLHGMPVGVAAKTMSQSGIGFDYVSDRLLSTRVATRAGRPVAGRAEYRTIVVPASKAMPPATLARLLQLGRDGATIVFVDTLPSDVPGLHDVERRRSELAALVRSLQWRNTASAGIRTARVGKGRALIGHDLLALLRSAGVERDPISALPGAQFVRQREKGTRQYFVVAGDSTIDEWITFPSGTRSAAILDPMSGRVGSADARTVEGRHAFRLQLRPHESRFVVLSSSSGTPGAQWRYTTPLGDATALRGSWSVSFVEGGPTLPTAFVANQPALWTSRGDADADRFAGTARYVVHFDAPDGATRHELDLGAVHESARIRLNGRELGTVVSAPFVIETGPLRPRDNTMEVDVTNLSANRIRDLDQRHVPWKIFRDINIVGIDYKPLDASAWPVRASGLEGPVTLRPVADRATPLP